MLGKTVCGSLFFGTVCEIMLLMQTAHAELLNRVVLLKPFIFTSTHLAEVGGRKGIMGFDCWFSC